MLPCSITCPNCEAVYKILRNDSIDLESPDNQTWPAVCPWCAYVFRWDVHEGTRRFTDTELRELITHNPAINHVRHQVIIDCLKYQPEYTRGTNESGSVD